MARGLFKMSRRRFLITLAGLGISGEALQHMSKDVLAQVTDDPKKEVPRLKTLVHTNHEEVKNGKPPKREPIYYTIPRDKWVQVESAHDAANRIKQKVREITDSSLVRVGVTEKTTGHRSKPIVVVRRDKIPNRSQQANISIEEISERLPATVDGNAGNKNVSEVVSAGRSSTA